MGRPAGRRSGEVAQMENQQGRNDRAQVPEDPKTGLQGRRNGPESGWSGTVFWTLLRGKPTNTHAVASLLSSNVTTPHITLPAFLQVPPLLLPHFPQGEVCGSD